jgi:hypothetical protein
VAEEKVQLALLYRVEDRNPPFPGIKTLGVLKIFA